jgi:hypothetical protein
MDFHLYVGKIPQLGTEPRYFLKIPNTLFERPSNSQVLMGK